MGGHPAVVFVVMAGGRGERLWPLVRAARPKVCLSPDGRRSLLQTTVERLRSAWPTARWLIVTTHAQAAAVRRRLPRSLRRSVVVEPQGKNTAACITLAAVLVAQRNPRTILVAVPADHWVGEAAVFRRSVRTAIRAAQAEETIATIGIRPTHPHPGLGYLCAGSPLNRFRSPRVFRLARFVEKPSREQAKRLLAGGRTYWNSGIFVGTAEAILRSVTEWLPNHARRLGSVVDDSRPGSVARKTRAAYARLEPVSFDHGVMDHLAEGLVVEGRFSWADLGSWDAWAQVGRTASRRLLLDSRNITVIGQEPHLVATIGVRDLLVVHTPSATLICPPSRAQAVRELVKRLSQHAQLAAYR